MTDYKISNNMRGVDYYEIEEPNPVENDHEATDYVTDILKEYSVHLEERTRHHLGYPYNLDFDFSALNRLQNFCVNNLGDPFVESNYGVHSRKFEIGVLQWFAKLWELNMNELWGYVTNCGTEGNFHGLLTGREVLPTGILYCSKATHYSVPKASRMYRMPLCLVNALEGGEIDLEDLRTCLIAGKAQGKPAIININIGTTVKGAVDDLDAVLDMLADIGYSRKEYYIHVDGALFGMMMNFVDESSSEPRRRLSFKKNIDSISVSGHKFIGAPVPCGIILTRKSHIDKLATDIEYLNSKDATIMGSRNGHAALYLWYAIQKKGINGFKRETAECLEKARTLVTMLKEEGIVTSLGPLSSTVVFERPTDHTIVRKWQLACEGEVAHVVVMPSTNITTLEEFVHELAKCKKQSQTLLEPPSLLDESSQSEREMQVLFGMQS